ncbi:hypothetical protein [Labrenzia sp. PHM005]|uniref:hypothetical protein n=1 Tax=Labrenzia sp. PHM005 TaxID=2590016 RepID=UPI00113FE2FA|nr:hypothetical protein [Labrenzia sp. PHM005]QDG78646.1 hypothetical protein FJ695_23810 [Labrenzia sp. PHM005]
MAIDSIGSSSHVSAISQALAADRPAQNVPDTKSASNFGDAVSISISEEARAFLAAASTGSLTGSDTLASGLSRELTGVVEDISEAVDFALGDDLDFEEQVSILAAGELFAKEIEALFNDFAGRPLNGEAAEEFLDRLGEAEDAFFDAFDDVFGADLSEQQGEFFDESMDELDALFEDLEEGLAGRELTAAEDALISKADGAFYDALDKIIGKDSDPTEADARLIDKTLADLSEAIHTVLNG